jgi:hypothetical protein
LRSICLSLFGTPKPSVPTIEARLIITILM